MFHIRTHRRSGSLEPHRHFLPRLCLHQIPLEGRPIGCLSSL
uniref:Uncharacterized protein n=1 Tax=Anguilla anguilla TaxID=7936 RepID=A0A0E9V6K6_ANGAN